MKIANPLYDHAFKYLMSNDRIARKVLSVILDKEVISLEPRQQEIVIEDPLRQFTLYRLDFKAQIVDKDGREETVLIELQKSKLPTNVLRFRDYLGATYSRQKEVPKENDVPSAATAYPIVSIYILGYNVKDIPVMAAKVDRKIIDASSNQELHIQSDFIDLLTHTCYILQVRRLPEHRRTRIEKLMTLFNQVWIKEKSYILDLEDVPEEFKDVAECLQRPLLEEDARKKLDAEKVLEDMFAEQEADLKEMERLVDEAKIKVLDAVEKRLQAEQEAEQAKQKAEQAKQKAEQAEQEKAQAEKKAKQIAQQKEQIELDRKQLALKFVKMLSLSGKTIEEIADEVGLTSQEVKDFLEH
ncbi:MAG: hypothetical protein R2795_24095 [Saprospiraceae bacterium]